MGHTVPASYTVRDVKIYNSKYFTVHVFLVVDIANKASLNHMVKESLAK